MKTLVIRGPISHEALQFSQAILSDLAGKEWIKGSLKEFLAHDPIEACDGARLLLEAMRLRVDETGDES